MGLKEDFLHLIKNQNARDLFCEHAELVIDSATESEIVDALPVVNILTKGGKFALSYRDHRFILKIERFLHKLSEIPEEEIDAFLEEIEKENLGPKIGDKLLGILERLDESKKAEILGALFKHYIKGGVNKDDFNLLCFAIDRAFIDDLMVLRLAVHNANLLDGGLGDALMACRLVETPFGLKHAGTGSSQYKVTRYGLKLVEIMSEVYEKSGD